MLPWLSHALWPHVVNWAVFAHGLRRASDRIQPHHPLPDEVGDMPQRRSMSPTSPKEELDACERPLPWSLPAKRNIGRMSRSAGQHLVSTLCNNGTLTLVRASGLIQSALEQMLLGPYFIIA